MHIKWVTQDMALMIYNKGFSRGLQKLTKHTALLCDNQALDFFGLSSNHTHPTKQDSKLGICSQSEIQVFQAVQGGEQQGRMIQKPTQMTAFKHV